MAVTEGGGSLWEIELGRTTSYLPGGKRGWLYNGGGIMRENCILIYSITECNGSPVVEYTLCCIQGRCYESESDTTSLEHYIDTPEQSY